MTDPASRLERRETALTSRIRVVPYVALAVSTLLALWRPWPRTTPVLPLLLTVAVAAGWMLFLVTLHPAWVERRRLMALFFLGHLTLTVILVSMDTVYGFFTFSGYLFAIYVLHGFWRLLGVAATALPAALSQVGGWDTLRNGSGLWIFGLIAVFNIAVACAMVWLAFVNAEMSQQRKVTIGELHDANTKLEAALAENAGLHAQLLTQAREAGVLDERQRLAGEIHDTLAQGLIGIVTQLEAAVAVPQKWTGHVLTATRLARENLTEARRSVHALRPEVLDGARLPEALTGVVARWSETNGVRATLTTTGTMRPLLPATELVLLRTAQEALANVAKHADASRVGLTLSYMETVVTLDVRDDGSGFDPSRPAAGSESGGYGLTAMRERIQTLAGNLEIESEPGNGTALSATVPLP